MNLTTIAECAAFLRAQDDYLLLTHAHIDHSGKLPLLKELRAEQRKLKAEKDKLYEKYCAERTSLSEIQDVKKNVDMILGTESGKLERKRKRPDELE